MKAMKCVICGYVYNEEIGDENHGILSGTKWEELPDDWLCPICSVGKDKFEIIEY